MPREEPVQYIEIDFDACSLTFGVGACTAILSGSTPDKCRNTWNTCSLSDSDRQNIYNKTTLTLRFIQPRPLIPIDGRHFFPKLKTVSSFSSTVNIAGFTKTVGSIGRRATVSATIDDFSYHDGIVDPYATQRQTGAAQFSGVGYNPTDRSTFWSKIRRWSPNYVNRPLRIVDTYIYLDDNGVAQWAVEKKTRHFIIKDIKQNWDNKTVTIDAQDVLTLAEKESAVAPKPSRGVLAGDISESSSTLILKPTGIGNSEYPAVGRLVVGSEVMSFTRVNDTVTLTGRGLDGTEKTSHNASDSVQVAKKFTKASLYSVLVYLLGETDIDPVFLDNAGYLAEFTRWAPSLQITTTLTSSEPVIEYLGELAALGVSVWWDDVDQKVKAKLNHPLDYTETVFNVSDDSSIKGMSIEDKDDERITQVHYYSVQADPTKSLTDKNNYDRVQVIIDADAQDADSYGDTRIKEVFCRWFNAGNDASVKIIANRYLQRFNTAPRYHTLTVDKKDGNIQLSDIIEVTSNSIVDDNGLPIPTNLQVIGKTDLKAGHEVRYTTQAYEFAVAASFIMANTANGYNSATALELERGCYIVDENTLVFPDGRDPYLIV